VAQDADLIKAVGKSGEVVVNPTENLAEGSYVFFITTSLILNCLQNCQKERSMLHQPFE
jgi:hypothetical protein